jgi:hypothetical protein
MGQRRVHLVGSVPLADPASVFETVGAALGDRLARIPDGETGVRLDWITWLEPVFAENPGLEKSPELFRVHPAANPTVRYRLKPGVAAADIVFGELGYGENAIRSYADFARLKRAGKIPASCRFQVDLVPAHSVIWLFLQDDLHQPLDPVFNDAVLREVDKIAAVLPHDQLAIQFDVASAVFARLARGVANAYGATREAMIERFAAILQRLANHVPDDIEVLFHLCYGDANHKHVVEPADMGDMVDFVTVLQQGMRRKVQLIHFPVPRDRSDDAYFAPLRCLRLPPETEICLGLVHYTDGLEGARRRMAAAQRYVADFSIATECGFGRRRPETLPELLRIHAAAADER